MGFLKNKLTNKAEQKTGMDLNGDGWVGKPQRHGGTGVNAMETVAGVDMNGDGRIGYRPGQGGVRPNHYGGYAPQPAPGGCYGAPAMMGGPRPAGNPIVNAVENATGMDLNGDGRVGNRPPAMMHHQGPPPGAYYGGGGGYGQPGPYRPY